MLKYYFLIAYRNLRKNRLYSFINIVGLSIGMTCFIVIALYLTYELSFDTQHKKASQIYRVAQQQSGNEYRGSDCFALAPMPLGPAIKETFPEVEAFTTITFQEALLSFENKAFYEEGIFADEYVFDMFSYSLLEGLGSESLKDPNNIILTESLARKYFGNTSPIGKTISFKKEKPLTVTGLIADLPHNQHFSFGFMTALSNFSQHIHDEGRWGSNNYRVYLRLPEGTDHTAFEKKFSVFDPEVKAAYRNLPFRPRYYLQPLLDIHLHSHINMEIKQNGDIRYIYFFAAIALIILLLAAINYTNLAIASSAQRAKEVGLRKVLGAQKEQLIFQFLGESFLLTLLSFSISLVFVKLILPSFNELLGQQIPFAILGNSSGMLLGMFLVAILIGGFSGLYPAFYLSQASSIQSLKGGLLKLHKKGAALRNSLVIGQFVAAIALAIASLIVFLQLKYTQDKKLGYNRDQIVYVTYRTTNTKISDQTETIRHELKKHPGIREVSFMLDVPLNSRDQGFVDRWEGNTNQSSFNIYRNYVDYDFLDLFEIKLVEGRNFSPEFSTDSSRTYLLNQAALKQLGWETAVGKEFFNGRVIGVVEDFHFQPFSLPIEPMFIRFFSSSEPNYSNIALKINMEEPEEVLAHVRKTLNTFAPQIPLEYKFLDDSYEQLYGSEKRLGQVFTLFTLLAIFIASMGSFGLISYHVLQRTKEIGIRKVLGATTLHIVSLLSRDFLKLVVIANIIAIPIAWFAMKNWLEGFAYSIELQWWMFTLVGILALAFAMLTVSSQTFKAAISKPVHALRDE